MLEITKRQLLIVLISFASLAVFTYFHRYPTGDDAWLGEQSFWLEKHGIIRSEYFRGLVGCEKQIMVSHKLFLLLGAGMIRLFGYGLPVLQFVGLIFFLILISELAFYVTSRERKINSWYLLAILTLVFSNRLLVKMSFQNRPEMMVAALGFGSFLFLVRKRISTSDVLIAGFLAGLALLCHLNGVIYLFAGFITLLHLRKYLLAFYFALAGTLTSIVYFVDVIFQGGGFWAWHRQFAGDPLTQEAFKISTKLIQLLTYPLLFFRSPEQIALSLLLVFLLWKQRHFIRQLPVIPKVYTGTLFLVFWLITKANGSGYMIIFIPFMLVLVYELYRINPVRSIGFKLVLATYLIIGAFGMCQIIYINLTMEYLPVSYKKLRPKIADHKTGFVPLTFFFDEYEEYPRLLTHENYELQSRKVNMNTLSMARWAYRNGVGFIVMDYKFRPETYYPKAGTKSIPFYKLKFFNGRFAVYER
jgi:hypothetical protein